MRSAHILAAIGGIFGAAMGALSGCWSAYDDYYVNKLDAGVACTNDTECDDKNPCTDDACKDGICKNDPNDSLKPPDDKNPCTNDTCMGGKATYLGNDMLVPSDDGKPCTDEKCVNGKEEHPPKSKNAECAMGSPLKCDGMGNCEKCATPEQCGSLENPCAYLTCETGACAAKNKPPGPSDLVQTPYDCQQKQCDGLGNMKPALDPKDVTPYANDCIDHVCNGQMQEEQVGSAVGTTCVTMQGDKGVCDGGDGAAAACKPCVMPAYGCEAGSICVEKGGALHCSPCTNMLLDPGEADVDCGGSDCSSCGNGKHCVTASDCTSSNCVDGYCCESACTANCSSCGVSGHEGACFSVPAGFVDMNADTPCSMSQACSVDGLCVGKASTSCNKDAQCLSGTCTNPACAKSDKGEPCSATSDCALPEICVNYICADP